MDESFVYRAFGKAVAARRHMLGATQLEVAERVGLSRGSLANIERGKQKVFLHQVLAFAYALELPSARELLPAGAPGPIEKAPRRPRVTGKHLSSEQKTQIEALLDEIVQQHLSNQHVG